MQGISNEELRKIIEEAKAAGKDETELERTLEDATTRVSRGVMVDIRLYTQYQGRLLP